MQGMTTQREQEVELKVSKGNGIGAVTIQEIVTGGIPNDGILSLISCKACSMGYSLVTFAIVLLVYQ